MPIASPYRQGNRCSRRQQCHAETMPRVTNSLVIHSESPRGINRIRSLCALILTTFCSLALGDGLSVTMTHPALAGYCVQTLRQQLSQMQQAMSCVSGITPQQCDEITQPFRATLANDQRTFNLWRAYALDLVTTDSAMEFLRETAEAKADIAYVADFFTAHP